MRRTAARGLQLRFRGFPKLGGPHNKDCTTVDTKNPHDPRYHSIHTRSCRIFGINSSMLGSPDFGNQMMSNEARLEKQHTDSS